MTWQLRALGALPEDQVQCPEPTLGDSQPPINPALGHPMPSSGLFGTYTHNIYSHICINKN